MKTFPLSPYRNAGSHHYISGQIGQINGQLVSDEIGKQTLQAIDNVATILKQNGLGMTDIVDVTVFLTEQDDYEAFNDAYRSSLKDPLPTRTTVTVKSLPLGARVELKVVAFK
ncbi:MAG TPA: RidA family protein [Candidatus Paceibacterota bacterium]